MRNNIVSIILGMLSLVYYPFLVVFGNLLWKIIGIHYLILCGVVFGSLGIVGIFFGIRAKKKKEKFALLGLVISIWGLVVIVIFVSFIYLIGYFWGG